MAGIREERRLQDLLTWFLPTPQTAFSESTNEKFKVSLSGGQIDGAFGELHVFETVHTGYFIPTFTSMTGGQGESQYKGAQPLALCSAPGGSICLTAPSASLFNAELPSVKRSPISEF